jgi:uroporphyrin-III C-methyltransferase
LDCKNNTNKEEEEEEGTGGVQVLYTNKYKGNAEKAQEEIHDWIMQGLKMGHSVLRIKGGDPFVFGRGGEEVVEIRKRWRLHQTCSAAVKDAQDPSLDIEILPGLSSSLVAPLAAGIPITHRGVADQILVSTGTKSDGTTTPPLPPFLESRTLVLLMSIHKLGTIMDDLVGECGYPKDLEVAVVERATCGAMQRVVRGTVGDVAEKVKQMGVGSHATVVVGGVVGVLDGDV